VTEAASVQARTSLRVLLRNGLRIDRSQSDPVVAFRNAVGVAGPLAVGALAGNAAIGLLATIGALQTAFADRPGPYRLRMLRMLTTAVAAATTSGLAVLASQSDAASVALLLALGFGAGLLLAGGPSAAQVGTAATAAALIIGHRPEPPGVALHVALLILAGGAVQAVLAIAAWPLRRHRPERFVLATLYRELAAIARVPPGTHVGPPVVDPLAAARAALYGLGHDHGPSVEAYRVLLDEADRIRREILVTAGITERLADEGEPILAGLVRGALAATGDVLEGVADALAQGRLLPADAYKRAGGALKHAISRLNSAAAHGEATRRAGVARLRALDGQLRAAVETASTGATEGAHEEVPRLVRLRGVRDSLATVRANLAPDSAVLRHAVRIAVLLAGSDLVLRLLHTPRGYWVSLTILVVLRPDFGATVQRAVLRIVGTILGLLLGTALVHWVPGGQWWLVALILISVFGMRLSGPNNYGYTAICLSAMVVVLLDISGVPAHTTLVARSLATLIGGGLAMAAILAFPTWERNLLPQRLAALLRAYRAYLTALGDAKVSSDALQRTRSACRRARTNAQASLDRVAAEPVPAPQSVELGRAVLAHTHRFVNAAMTLDAVRASVLDAGGSPELGVFLDLADAALAAAHAAVVRRRAPQQLPKLRAAEEELEAALERDPDAVGGAEPAAVVVEAADRMTDSLDTLLAELRRQLGAPRTEQPAVPTST
jgi:uncharacterized membrane protein YccC